MPEYILRDGLRFVKPYYREKRVSVKGRWYGRFLLDVLGSEFRDTTVDIHREHIESGLVKVHRRIKKESVVFQQKSLFKHLLKNGDQIVTQMHWHEPPIVDAPIKVIYEDDDLVVVNKPSGIPIHPVRTYFYNTLVELLKQQVHASELKPCFRLDKVTSGICILAKKVSTAHEIQQGIRDKQITKVYVARVEGKFPEECVCNDDVLVVDSKRGLEHGVESRSATTQFKLVRYSEKLNQSIVECRPLTGRTHQIRIHLRNLGHPIVNDYLYKQGVFAANKDYSNPEVFDSLTKNAETTRKNQMSGSRCTECGTNLYLEPERSKLVLYLHAMEYYDNGGKWKYSTEQPDWCQI
ncbi:hypothetical protein OGAPHI_001413 [Ogataea philodendri]|uniref:Pseudouridine synthase n=1 Tax=Ogataea philodendri TaxID=1378263 RepID=A0A9P8PCE7_9ASCO|nr:uncharacterized protein OGAPHI_001413 [Ogataea philodendri]KAH3669292.1 hypothetical protein OGAPHI_001413 [Ogataea philodendri]